MPNAEKLLVVDDAPNWSKVLQTILSERYEVILASSVQKAEEAIKKGDLTRILSDGLDGQWEEIFGLSQKAGIPFKVLSGNSDVLKRAKELNVPTVNKYDISVGDVDIKDL